MAQKTVVELVDDLDGGKASETVAFALDGVEFQIDLSSENANRLRETLAQYMGRARRIGNRGRGGKIHGAAHAGNGKPNSQAIREWARSQGENVAERGRLSHDLVVRFQEAHAG